MANPVEERIVSAPELVEGKRPGAPTVINPLADHVPLDDEAVIAILSGYHKATVLLGHLESRKRGKHKTAIMRGLAASLTRDLELLAAYVYGDEA